MYRVERLEGATWRILMQCDFEDTEQFVIIAQNPIYRIMKDDKDITSEFVNNSQQRVSFISPNESKSLPVTQIENTSKKSQSLSALKPAAYRALSVEEKEKLINKAAELKEAKYKRADIMAELNVTESTYDIIRADSVKSADNNAETAAVSKPIIATPPTAHTTTARKGLLNRR